jgi:hypothetical protein
MELAERSAVQKLPGRGRPPRTATDRNRAYGALGHVFDKPWKAEVGFMRQIREQNSRNQFQLVVFNSLPLSK